MPRVIEQDGFRVMIYNPPREHGPAHVHVFHAGHELIVELGPPVAIREGWMPRKRATAALMIIADNLDFLFTRWETIHGSQDR